MEQPFLGYSPISVANSIIELKQKDLTILKLLKLCYIAHGFNLALNNRPLVAEHAQAWEYGPVFPSIYHAFKMIKPPITAKLSCENENIEKNDKEVISLVNRKYGTLTGWELSALTHAKGTPWDQSKSERKSIISNNTIKNYYKLLPQKT